MARKNDPNRPAPREPAAPPAKPNLGPDGYPIGYDGWKEARVTDIPSPLPWRGTKESWLIGHSDWSGAFAEYPLQSNEKVWAPDRPDDYCRRIARQAETIGLLIKASYIKTVYLKRPKLPK